MVHNGEFPLARAKIKCLLGVTKKGYFIQKL